MRVLARLRRRKPEVDRELYPFDYVGPATKWGLETGTPCRVVGKGGADRGRRIMDIHGRRWTVHASTLRRIR